MKKYVYSIIGNENSYEDKEVRNEFLNFLSDGHVIISEVVCGEAVHYVLEKEIPVVLRKAVKTGKN